MSVTRRFFQDRLKLETLGLPATGVITWLDTASATELSRMRRIANAPALSLDPHPPGLRWPSRAGQTVFWRVAEGLVLDGPPESGRTRVARLLAMPELLAALESLGYLQSVRALRDGQRQNVHHLPLLLRSAADFHDIFPDAAMAPSAYYSRLAGDGAWLACAVDDFFANGGGTLWLVQVPDDSKPCVTA